MTRLSPRHRKAIKIAWASLCTRSRITDGVQVIRRWWLGSPLVAILTYHRVLPADQATSVFSSPHIITTKADFEAQIQHLVHHYRILSLEEYAEMRENPGPLPLRCAIVTFDDGWRDNYLYALPTLKKYRVPATIFLTTGFIGRNRTFWQERLRFLIQALWGNPTAKKRALESALSPWADDISQRSSPNDPMETADFIIGNIKEGNGGTGEPLIEELNRCAGNPEIPVETHGFLTWDQVREMSQHQITFGSHTHGHRLLTNLPADEIKNEIRTSKQRIEMELGQKISALAYPNGAYGPDIFALLQASGFKFALTTKPGLNSFHTHPYQLRRINMESHRFSDGKGRFSKTLFAARLAGVF